MPRAASLLSPSAMRELFLDLLEDQACAATVTFRVEGADPDAHAGQVSRLTRHADLDVVERELAGIGEVLRFLRHGVVHGPQGPERGRPRLVEAGREVPQGLVPVVVDVADDAGRGADGQTGNGEARAGERHEAEDSNQANQAESAHGSFLFPWGHAGSPGPSAEHLDRTSRTGNGAQLESRSRCASPSWSATPARPATCRSGSRRCRPWPACAGSPVEPPCPSGPIP